MKQELSDYMSARRICSVSNLMIRFGISFDEIMPVLKELEDNGTVRIARSVGCAGSCGDRSSCGDLKCETGDPGIIIVISIRKRKEEDDG